MDRICNDCGRPFIITKSDRAYCFKNRQPLPCRCRQCHWRHKDAPQLWFVNRNSGELESVTVLHSDGENLCILFHGLERKLNSDVIGSRLFRTPAEARKRKRTFPDKK